MKKKTLALILSALMCLCISTASADVAEHTIPELYAISYDDSVYTLDGESYVDDRGDDYAWLYMLYNDTVEFDAEMTKLERYEGFSLFAAPEEERARYEQDTLDLLSDYSGELVTVLEVPAGASSIPFYIYHGADEDGAYLMAETVANGYSLAIYAYYVDNRLPTDDALLGELTALLNTFKPL